MNKADYLFLLVLLSVGLIFATPTNEAYATVGGPTYVSSIAYRTGDNFVYYNVHSSSGRGCPTIVHKIDLTTLTDTEVKSCNQYEQEFANIENGNQKYQQFIADTYRDLSYLKSISLEKNNIEVRAEFLSEEIRDGFRFWSEFVATITQDGQEIAKINFRGCEENQPNVFEGYIIPNSNLMAMLISNKNDCFEGGYVNESLRIVKNVKYYDTNAVRNFKESSATEPNLGNVIVYANSKNERTDDTKDTNQKSVLQEKPSSESEKYPNLVVEIMILVLTLLSGLVLGYLFGKKTNPPTNTNFPNPAQ